MNTSTQTINSDSGVGGSSTTLLVVGVIGLVIGALGASPMLSEGGAAFNQGSNMIWGLPVVGYAFLALASFGVAMVASLGLVFRINGFTNIVRPSLALALGLLVGSILVLALELGNAVRALWAIPLNMQIRSPLLWMGVFWLGFIVFLVLTLMHLRTARIADDKTRKLGIGVLLFAFGALYTQGMVYGMMVMRPVWYGAATPLYFLIGSVLLGLAIVMLVTHITHRMNPDNMSPATRGLLNSTLPMWLLAIAVVYAITVLARLTTGLWSVADGVQVVYQQMLASPLFWFEILVCLAVPIVLLAMPQFRRQLGMQVLAASLLIIGLFIARYEFIIGGQMVPLFKGAWISGLNPSGFVPYTPSLVEWSLVLIGVSVALVVFGLADRYANRDAPAQEQ